jgi:hypothetical protein
MGKTGEGVKARCDTLRTFVDPEVRMIFRYSDVKEKDNG